MIQSGFRRPLEGFSIALADHPVRHASPIIQFIIELAEWLPDRPSSP
jgi:hypothetical protein